MLVMLSFSSSSLSLQAQTSADPKSVPVIDGGIGPCSADFTITDATGAPIYAATIRVHIAYRFLNAHKLDLEVGTNAAGKARFTGLPEKTKQGLFFRASEGDREGSAFDDPAKTCKAELTIALERKSQ
ncbi:MAG: carboxypeptidase-like regulatory domain-containing protein [Candidatus Sulfotelmatobacter sp.]